MLQSLVCPNGHCWEHADAVDVSASTCPICGIAPRSAQAHATESPTVTLLLNTIDYISVQNAASAKPAASEPVVIPGYEILGVLGHGGMGVVYKARHIKLKRLIALKMIRAGAHADPRELERFRLEAEAVARLQHPNVVQIHEVGEHDGQPYFSLEFVDGGSLRDKLAGTPLPPREAARLVETLAWAMYIAHEHGVIHRDLKPANVLMTKDGTPKITDFGLAKQLGNDSGQTQSGEIMGTASYMAPEQATGNVQALGPPTDIYALGALLYETLTGRPPFKAASVLDTLEQVRTQEPVPPSQLQPKTPRDLETICLKCLQKAPAKRYASAAALADDLRRWLAGEPILARPVGMLERTWRWCKRKPALATANAAVLVALATFVVAFLVVKGSLGEAEKLTADNKEIAKKESRARIEADLGRDEADTNALRIQFETYSSKAGSRPQETLVGMASLMPKAVSLKDQALSDSLRLRVEAWSEHAPPLKAIWEDIGQISAVALSDDGTTALTGSSDGRARLWQMATGKPIGQPLQHPAPIKRVALSADGATALTVCNGTVRAWKTATGEPIGPPLSADVGCVALSADGKTALTGSGDKTARLWKTATGEPIGPPLEHKSRVLAVALSADGKAALTGSVDKTARLWKTATGEPIGPPLEHQGIVFAVALSADGATALTGSFDGTAALWKTANGERIATLPHQGKVVAVALSTDGKTALTGSMDKTARLWTTASGWPIGQPLLHSGLVVAVALSADGRTALTGSHDHTARLWDSATGTPLGPPLQHDDRVNAVALSPDGTTALTGGNDSARVWETATGHSKRPPPLLLNYAATAVALSADGKTALCQGSGEKSNSAYLWDTVNSLPLGPPLVHQSEVSAITLSADGKTAMTGSKDGTAHLWETATGERIGPPLQHPAPIDIVALSADGKTALTGCGDYVARLWHAATGKSIRQLQHQSKVIAVALSADGKTVLIGNEDKTARLWETATGKQIGPLLKHNGRVTAVTLSADGKTAMTGSADRTARLWETTTGKLMRPPLLHETTVRAVALSADGKTAMTGTENDGVVRLWEMTTGQQIGPPLLQLYRSSITSTSLSANGKTGLIANTSPAAARRWHAPPPMRGGPERIKLWIEVITGLEADERTGVRVLDAAAWQQRRQRLQELGEPVE